ncbi:hypothetical protein Sipo8835_21030 [Streptomyces ipomoeae]|uniref:Uncharacterized protein n=2 Tax=Streptomyces ipomoeae TaxID=103232 RepID=L1KPU0_9ACTN|nr:hypothetical protein [Streptomyces ipomoeae]EKX62383.1 hypothetical protein STRIP9103_08874 [Streptomyces ipomoeae 91-03]MDX2694787.1 hypothetical protein [Streptomyces ipomoeae]MDX2821669.1 hypothetical protein [Streptomyces ipomoeae]MDX2840146.1 hypothetical protein [Streptomyces ipomoeae]MDX2874326.1 hypothetical protein [Streptomyces ipomoeae]
MTDHREGPGENADPVPRDLPDQQAGAGEDPWEVAPAGGDTDEDDASAADVPDTDEAGTGRQGAPRSGAVNPEQPVPDESSG